MDSGVSVPEMSLTMVESGDKAVVPSSHTRSKSFAKLLAVLEIVREREGKATCASIASATGLNRTTVWRLLGDLEAVGFVSPDDAGRFRLGYSLLTYGLAAMRDQARSPAAHAILLSVRDRAGETCHLALPDGDALVYVDKVESKSSVRVVSSIGKRIELHCTALGKAYLAFAPREQRETLVKRIALPTRTSATITDRTAFVRELEQVRLQGWAMDNEENEKGIRCIGAPILDGNPGNAAAAISITAPVQRMSRQQASRLAPLLCEAARAISAEWRGRGGRD